MTMTDSAAGARGSAVVHHAPAQATDPFGVYVHVPFCAHICPYCDFNTYAGQSDRIPNYVEAIERETEIWGAGFTGRDAASIFIGGGTPSLLSSAQVSTILASCKQSFPVVSDAEITIEANPNDLGDRYCAELLKVGVNRMSIGAQTLDRTGLRVLGRRHEATTVAKAVRAARGAGFTNISLDFIYGWPGQTLAQWRDDLERILAGDVGGSPPDHLSLYGLIVEPGTPMADAVQRGILSAIDDDEAAEFAELASRLLEEAGWIHYEIANWSASPGTASMHNAIYWRNGDYAGLGAGAHGHVAGKRTMNHLAPQTYVNALRAGNAPISNVETISEQTAMAETMMLGLRLLRDGVSPESFHRRHGVSIEEQFGPQLSKLSGMGHLEIHHDRVRLTERGSLLANAVCAEFL